MSIYELTTAALIAISEFAAAPGNADRIKAVNDAMPRRGDDTAYTFLHDAGDLVQIGGGADYMDVAFYRVGEYEGKAIGDRGRELELGAELEKAVLAQAKYWLADAREDVRCAVEDALNTLDVEGAEGVAHDILAVEDAYGLTRAPHWTGEGDHITFSTTEGDDAQFVLDSSDEEGPAILDGGGREIDADEAADIYMMMLDRLNGVAV